MGGYEPTPLALGHPIVVLSQSNRIITAATSYAVCSRGITMGSAHYEKNNHHTMAITKAPKVQAPQLT